MTTGSDVPSPQNTPLTGDEKLWIILSHVSYFIGVPLILPLIIYLVKKGESPRVTHHAREALNFHLSVLLYGILCIVLIITSPLLIVLGIGAAILTIVALIKSLNGSDYRYPLTIRFVK